MAEAVGLAFGGVALAGLVTTCVDILEYTRDARYWMYDLSIARTKVALLQDRLNHLGDLYLAATSAECDTSSDDPRALRHSCRCDTATQGLSGVESVLEQTNRLCRRYIRIGHVEDEKHYSPAYQSHNDAQPSSLHDAQLKQSPLAALKPWRRVSRQLSWALQDKKKFDKLILDLDFLLSNTEQLFERAAPLCASPTCAQSKLRNNSHISPLPLTGSQLYVRDPCSKSEDLVVSTIACTQATEDTMNIKFPQRSAKQAVDSREDSIETFVLPAEPNDSVVLYNPPSPPSTNTTGTRSQITMEQQQPSHRYTAVTITNGSGISIQARDENGIQGPVELGHVKLDAFSHISVGGGEHALSKRLEIMQLEHQLAQLQFEREKLTMRKDYGGDAA